MGERNSNFAVCQASFSRLTLTEINFSVSGFLDTVVVAVLYTSQLAAVGFWAAVRVNSTGTIYGCNAIEVL